MQSGSRGLVLSPLTRWALAFAAAAGADPAPLPAACPGSALVFFDDFESSDTIAWTAPGLGGYSRDFWTGAPLAGTTLTLAAPARNDTSGADGTYHLLDLALPTALAVVATRPAGYRATANGPIAWSGASRSCDLYSMSTADVTRQYATIGLTETAGRSIVVAYLQAPDGSPLEGIPLADLALTDGGGNPIGAGPYFFGLAGDVDAGITVSTAFGGSVRFAYLDVPAGSAILSVASADPAEEDTETLTVAASGANLVVLGGTD